MFEQVKSASHFMSIAVVSRKFRPGLLGCFALLCLASATSFGAAIEGQLSFTGRGADKAQLNNAVIYIEFPDTPETVQRNITDSEESTPDVVIEMKKKRFSPRVSVVEVGSEIQLPNMDSIKHNAFSPSKPNDFDAGTYNKNESQSVTIQHPGIIRIYCNVHYRMSAYVVAVDTPYFIQPDRAGNFSLRELPEAAGRLTVWHENGDPVTIDVDTRLQNQPIDLMMKIAKRRVPKHKNKFGKSYSTSRYKRY